MCSRAWFVAVMTGLAVACGSTVNVGRERSLLLEVDQQWSQSTNDVDKFLSYYAPDAAVYPPGMPIAQGTAPIREAFTKMRSMPGFSLQWKPTGATVSGAGDLGYTTGTYRMTINDPTGTPIPERGKYVAVWKKQPGGQWKVAEDIFNADTPPPVPASKVEPPTPTKASHPKAKPGKSSSRKRHS